MPLLPSSLHWRNILQRKMNTPACNSFPSTAKPIENNLLRDECPLGHSNERRAYCPSGGLGGGDKPPKGKADAAAHTGLIKLWAGGKVTGQEEARIKPSCLRCTKPARENVRVLFKQTIFILGR